MNVTIAVKDVRRPIGWQENHWVVAMVGYVLVVDGKLIGESKDTMMTFDEKRGFEAHHWMDWEPEIEHAIYVAVVAAYKERLA
jgi:hypothetical protein